MANLEYFEVTAGFVKECLKIKSLRCYINPPLESFYTVTFRHRESELGTVTFESIKVLKF